MVRINWIIAFIFLSFMSTGARASVEKAPPVVFGEPVRSTQLFELFTYPARVIPKVNTTILAEVDGVVSRIEAPLGQGVRRHQSLLVLTHTDPIYQYAPFSVLSPIAGVVSEVAVSEGTQVTKGQKLGSVTDPRQLRVTVEIPAADLRGIRKGMEGEFKLLSRDDTAKVRVLGVSPFVDPSTGTATCEFEIDSKDREKLAPGLVGRVNLKANAHDGISIPEFAVLYRDDKTYVRTYLDGKSKMVPVKLGRKQQGTVEVLSGLKDKDFLIERASRYVADGEAVTLQTGEEKN